MTGVLMGERNGRDKGGRASGTAVEDRRRFGTRPLAALLPRIVRPAFKRRSPATATLLTDWAAIVGPEDAATTTPLRVASGVLTVGCDGPTALELQHREARLIERINLALGDAIVRRIRIVQAPPPASAPVPPRRAGTGPGASPSRAEPVRVDGAPDGPLGDALARLRAAIVARKRA